MDRWNDKRISIAGRGTYSGAVNSGWIPYDIEHGPKLFEPSALRHPSIFGRHRFGDRLHASARYRFVSPLVGLRQ